MTSTIWKILADPDRALLYLENRNQGDKSVTFSALDLFNNRWLWNDVGFEEKWWIGLSAVSANTLLFTIYTDTQNPDKKAVMAYDVKTQTIRWFKNNFAVSFALGETVTGIDMQFGRKEIVLDLITGELLNKDILLTQAQNFEVIRPFHYQEGTGHFESVTRFVEMKERLSPRFSVEYCEHRGLIFISAFFGDADLANYLFVYNSEGNLLIKETLGEGLKGIAADTFFLYAGFLIFVKNKNELVCYKFV